MPAHGGRALDLACGRGGNALYLARAGLRVDGWDISTVVIEELAAPAVRESLSINAEVRNVEQQPPAAKSV